MRASLALGATVTNDKAPAEARAVPMSIKPEPKRSPMSVCEKKPAAKAVSWL
jgi:hypothetical protein